MFLAVSRVVMLRALLGYSGKGSSAFPIFVGHGLWFVYGLGGFVLGCVSRGRICLVSSPGLQVWAWSGVCRGGVAGLIVFLAMCFLLVTISLDPFPLCCTLSSLVPTLPWLGGRILVCPLGCCCSSTCPALGLVDFSLTVVVTMAQQNDGSHEVAWPC